MGVGLRKAVGCQDGSRGSETFNASPRLLAAVEALTLAALALGHVSLVGGTALYASQHPLRVERAFAWPRAPELEPLVRLFGLYWGVIAVHLALVQLDPAATAWVGRDYAQALYGIEGSSVAWFQSFRAPALDVIFLVAYLFGYPFMIYFAPLFYLAHRDARALRLAALSFVALYALTIPFYVLMPISNPWAVAGQAWYQGTPVDFRLGQLWPDIVPSYWQFTTPNNEMPSLHAAISCMTALVAWRAGYRRFALVAGAFAVLIPVASFYMGVHWILDAVVGEAFAVAAVAIGAWVATRARTPSASAAPGGTEGADGT
jgi:PAP2 superfamily protein